MTRMTGRIEIPIPIELDEFSIVQLGEGEDNPFERAISLIGKVQEDPTLFYTEKAELDVLAKVCDLLGLEMPSRIAGLALLRAELLSLYNHSLSEGEPNEDPVHPRIYELM